MIEGKWSVNSQVIDGLVDSDEWDSIVPLEVLQKVPDAGAMPSQKTEIRMTYDDLNIYLSCRSFDEHPELIVANTKKRDDFTENTEWCGFLIDSYDDRENALAFFSTPTNAKLDMALSGDIEGPSPFNLSWNSFWESAVSRTEEGWFLEIKVPFSSLSFEEKEGKVKERKEMDPSEIKTEALLFANNEVVLKFKCTGGTGVYNFKFLSVPKDW